jgi:alpha-glucoside transport system permease protein
VSNLEGKLAMLAVGVVAFVVVAGVILLIVDNWPERMWRTGAQTVWFVVPALLLVGVGLVYPALQTFVFAFQGNQDKEFVGFANFAWMFSDTGILLVIKNTAIWVLLTPILATAIGLIYAILIDKARGEAIAKVFVFLPMAISFVGAGIIWKFVYAYRATNRDQIGLLNGIWVGLGGQSQQFLLNPPLNTMFLIVVMVWIQAGFAMVVLSAALKGIPMDMIEAARLDGVNAWQMFTRITIPSIRPTLVVVYVTITIGVLKVFDIVRTMTGANFDTNVVANEMYEQSFVARQEGYGSALAVFLFLLVMPVVIYQVRQLARQRSEAR